MGRNKIKIAKLEKAYARKNTYKKRLNGLVKKAKEFSILMDVPVLLLAVSPTDQKFTLAMGANSNFYDIVQQYAHLTPEKIQQLKMEVTDKLRRAYDIDGNVADFDQQMHRRTPIEDERVKMNNHSKVWNKINGCIDQVLYQMSLSSPKNDKSEKKTQLEKLQDDISKNDHYMGPLAQLPDLDKVENLDKIIEMESCLLNALNLNELKRKLLQQQLAQIQCSNKAEIDMQLPQLMNVNEEVVSQPSSNAGASEFIAPSHWDMTANEMFLKTVEDILVNE